jgi:hypothetical protein
MQVRIIIIANRSCKLWHSPNEWERP